MHVLETMNTSLRDLNLPDTCDCEDEVNIEILIGLDFYLNLVMGGVIKLTARSITLRSKFGYILFGPLEDMKQLPTSACYARKIPFIDGTTTNLFRVDVTSEENITDSLNKFQDIESMGINEEKPKFTDSFPIVYDGSRYEVQLLCEESHQFLEENYHLTKRLLSQLKR